MKINQYCSVCKKQLDMEVISTDDGGDDGVIWLRCPECQGFLPKFTGEGLAPSPAAGTDPDEAAGDEGAPGAATTTDAEPDAGPSLDTSDTSDPADGAVDPEPDVTDVPAPDLEAVADIEIPTTTETEPDTGPVPGGAGETDSGVEAEPIAEYAAMLAETDVASARPYRPSSRYSVGDAVHHLAYDDIGVVVGFESIPGGRTVAKVFFEKAGVVRLIAQAADPE
ncbi:hypothetical protein GF314_12025 [bacterium]|nr:hypothetical protein [bacterium]